MKRSEITKRPERIVLVLIDINRYHASNVAEKKKKKKKREVFQPWKVSKMPLFITTRPAVFEPHLVH